jgi:thiamine biosynthesis lipoprotein
MTKQQPETCFVKGGWDSISGIHRFSREAMGTTYEIIIQHDDARYAEQAANAAFDKLDGLEAELSRFIENSDISRINNLPVGRQLQIGLAAFECLQLSRTLFDETNGAFDVTIGSLLSCWRNKDGTARAPSQAELDAARQHTGMHLVKLDEQQYTVELLRSPVQIDLGAIGKGYALGQMAELLREWSIDTALIHGGFSTVLALDAPDRTKGWPLSLSSPDGRKQTLAYIHLQNWSVSGSGVEKGQHIIDPRTGQPAAGKSAAWVCVADPAYADGLSTAFMVMSPDEIKRYCLARPEAKALVILRDEEHRPLKDRILHFGPWGEDELVK